jgi:flagellar biosynthetic protein FliR
MIQVLIDSFQSLPVGISGLTGVEFQALVAWGGRMFAGAVLIALTAMTAMLLVNLAFGVMSRAAPQLNIFGVGFPVMIGMGFVVILMALPSLGGHVSDLMQEAFDLIGSLVKGEG